MNQIHYNTLKTLVKNLYDIFKLQIDDSNTAMKQALNSVLLHTNILQVVHPSKVFSSIEELKDFLVNDLQFEVNQLVPKDNRCRN